MRRDPNEIQLEDIDAKWDAEGNFHIIDTGDNDEPFVSVFFFHHNARAAMKRKHTREMMAEAIKAAMLDVTHPSDEQGGWM